jgi:hypothetical protein
VHSEDLEPPKQQLLLPPGHTASLWWSTCAATAGCPTVMICTLAGLPGGKWQRVTFSAAGATFTPLSTTARLATRANRLARSERVFMSNSFPVEGSEVKVLWNGMRRTKTGGDLHQE